MLYWSTNGHLFKDARRDVAAFALTLFRFCIYVDETKLSWILFVFSTRHDEYIRSVYVSNWGRVIYISEEIHILRYG